MTETLSFGAKVVKPFKSSVLYVRNSIEELKKVTWPSREQAIQYTVIVIASVLIVTGILTVVDYGFSKLLEQLISWSQR